MEDSFFFKKNAAKIVFYCVLLELELQWVSTVQGVNTAVGNRPFHPVLIWGLFSLEAAEGKPWSESTTIAETYTSNMQLYLFNSCFSFTSFTLLTPTPDTADHWLKATAASSAVGHPLVIKLLILIFYEYSLTESGCWSRQKQNAQPCRSYGNSKLKANTEIHEAHVLWLKRCFSLWQICSFSFFPPSKVNMRTAPVM